MLFPFSFFPDSSTEVGMEVYLQSKTLKRGKVILFLKAGLQRYNLYTVKLTPWGCSPMNFSKLTVV